MAESAGSPPIDKPDIVVPDAAPLIHLAAAGLLHLLHQVGGVVVVVDMVAHEITRDLSKPGAADLRTWLAAGREPGSNTPVRVEETETGRLYAAVLETRPDYKLRNAGETAIVEWLAEHIAGTDRAVIVLYENGRVPTIVRNQSLDADIDVLTTRAFLDGLERRERDRRSEASTPTSRYWDRVVTAEPTTNPRLQTFSQRRPRGQPRRRLAAPPASASGFGDDAASRVMSRPMARNLGVTRSDIRGIRFAAPRPALP